MHVPSFRKTSFRSCTALAPHPSACSQLCEPRCVFPEDQSLAANSAPLIGLIYYRKDLFSAFLPWTEFVFGQYCASFIFSFSGPSTLCLPVPSEYRLVETLFQVEVYIKEVEDF